MNSSSPPNKMTAVTGGQSSKSTQRHDSTPKVKVQAPTVQIPVNEYAEVAVLGALLCGADFTRVTSVVAAADFYDERHRHIYEAFARLAAGDRPLDLLTTPDQLERDGALEAAGGRGYVDSLADGLPDTANVLHYAAIVANAARRREMQHLGREVLETAGRRDVDANELALRAALTLSRLASTKDREAASSDQFEQAVTKEALTLKVRAEAKRRLIAEGASQRPFDAALLRDIADEPVQWRVKGLLQKFGRLLIAAIRKSGKTTTVLNLIRDLILGGDFLGRFAVTPITGCVALLNFEVSRQHIAQWAREVGIPGDRLLIVNLRGCSNPFADPEDTARLAELMREHAVEVIIVDPFGRAYPGKSQNDAGEVGAFLAVLDRFVEAAGASELILNAHAGWEGERTRGSSALEDWADAVATIVRDKEDEKLRFFRAIGRDVEVEEDHLEYDPTTRRLTLAGTGSRATARAGRRTEELIAGVVEAVTAEPGATTGRLEALLREAGLGIQRGDVGRAAREAASAGLIVRVPGKQRRQHHFLKGHEDECSRLVPTSPAGNIGGVSGVVPTPPIRRRTTTPLLDPVGAPVVPPGPLDPEDEL